MQGNWKRKWLWDGEVAHRFHAGKYYKADVVIDRNGLCGRGMDNLLGVAMGCVKDDDNQIDWSFDQ